MKIFFPGSLAFGLLSFALSWNLLGAPGDKKWEFATGHAVTDPVIGDDGTVYFGMGDPEPPATSPGMVYALDGATGQKKWEFPTPDQVYGSPAVGPDGGVIAATFHAVYALDSANGQMRWVFPSVLGPQGTNAGPYQWEWDHRPYFHTSPAMGADGTVYAGTGMLYVNNEHNYNQFYALDYATGAKKWVFPSVHIPCPAFTDPVIGSDGTVYVSGIDYPIIKVFALQGATGEKLWEFQFTAWWDPSLAMAADGTLIVAAAGAEGGQVYGLDGRLGLKKWEMFTSEFPSRPAIGNDGTVFLFQKGRYPSTTSQCYAVDSATGQKKWDFTSDIQAYGSPAIGADGSIYVSGESILALDSVTGAKKWEILGDQYAGYTSPAIGRDGTIFIGRRGGNRATMAVYAFEGDGTNRLSNSPWPMFHRNVRNTGQMPAAPRFGSSFDPKLLLEGEPATWPVLVGGEPLPQFQWFLNGQPLPGATNAAYFMNPVSTNHEGNYALVASNALGMVTNGPALLRVYNTAASNFVGLVFHGAAGAPLQLQYAEDLRNSMPWRLLAELTPPSTPWTFIDLTATNASQRFYRTTTQAMALHFLKVWNFPGWMFTAPAGSQHRIDYVDAQDNFSQWQFLTNLTLPNSPYRFVDITATNKWQRFYRTTRLP